jgi:hypothetical protein
MLVQYLESTGLSRRTGRALLQMMRGFGGDLVYGPFESGCRFDVIAPTGEAARTQVA